MVIYILYFSCSILCVCYLCNIFVLLSYSALLISFFFANRITDFLSPLLILNGSIWEVNHVFHDRVHHLAPILDKDSVRRFPRFIRGNGAGMQWGSIITPEALNHMIAQNAVKCVKAALEGQAPELDGCRAGPNCMNQYGYYPLHRAAEFFWST